MAADPEPQISIGLFDGKSAVSDGNAGGPDFSALALTDLLEMQRGVSVGPL